MISGKGCPRLWSGTANVDAGVAAVIDASREVHHPVDNVAMSIESFETIPRFDARRFFQGLKRVVGSLRTP